MSVDVKYKGATIATLEAQETKTLTTAGKYCEADIVLTDDSNPVAEDNDVIFIDYDGTIRYSYTADEFLALTELPPNPTHEGLTAQGWNWALEDAQIEVRKAGFHVIGQTYITDDGCTRLYIHLSDATKNDVVLYFTQTVANGVVIDWGDDSGTSSDATTGAVSVSHSYSVAGRYLIRMAVSDGCYVALGSNNNCLLGPTGSYFRRHTQILTDIRIGRNVTGINAHGLSGCTALRTITIPSQLTTYGDHAISYCHQLIATIFPMGLQQIGGANRHMCNSSLRYTSIPKLLQINSTIPTTFCGTCMALDRVLLPDGVKTLNTQSFQNCYSVKRVYIPDGVTAINTQAFHNCQSLIDITVPSTVNTIGSYAFNNCSSLAKIIFMSTTPPTVSNATAWGSIPTDCKIYVPRGTLSAYTTATNYPDPNVYTYIEY